jgi:glutathione S-transferase
MGLGWFGIALTLIDIRNAPLPFFLKPIVRSVASNIEGFIHPELKRQLDYIESQMRSVPDGGPYLCGKSLTGSDFIMSYPIQACKEFKLVTQERHPKLMAWIGEIEATASYKQAVKKTIDLDGSFSLFVV